MVPGRTANCVRRSLDELARGTLPDVWTVGADGGALSSDRWVPAEGIVGCRRTGGDSFHAMPEDPGIHALDLRPASPLSPPRYGERWR
jgi:hypothetical protein